MRQEVSFEPILFDTADVPACRVLARARCPWNVDLEMFMVCELEFDRFRMLVEPVANRERQSFPLPVCEEVRAPIMFGNDEIRSEVGEASQIDEVLEHVSGSLEIDGEPGPVESEWWITATPSISAMASMCLSTTSM